MTSEPFASDFEVLEEGTLTFMPTGTRFGLENGRFAILEPGRHGRRLVDGRDYLPADVWLLASQLFASRYPPPGAP